MRFWVGTKHFGVIFGGGGRRRYLSLRARLVVLLIAVVLATILTVYGYSHKPY